MSSYNWNFAPVSATPLQKRKAIFTLLLASTGLDYRLTISVWAASLSNLIQTYKKKGPFGTFQPLKVSDTLVTNVLLEYIKEIKKPEICCMVKANP